MFSSLSEKGVSIKVELKNGLILEGKLGQCDEKLNFNLYDLNVDFEKYPQLASLKNMFIRGSSIRYVHLSPQDLDPIMVEEAFKKTLED